ncbi:MAG: glycosyltransferase family 2 protein [Oxalobacter sp.]|nr:MAG: glycosyltransferase family 2 protein [Oxalobacter sp.]
MYMPVKIKFAIAFCVSLLWGIFSYYLDLKWIYELSDVIGEVPAYIVIFGIAIIPGYMSAFLLVSLLLDQRPKRTLLETYPPITILVAAYNEASAIVDTIHSIGAQDYRGELDVIVVDDGSNDATAALITATQARYPWLRLVNMSKNGGKARALNFGLEHARHDLIITLDADSFLYQESLQRLVERYVNDPPNTRAVAGAIVVRNSRKNWITNAQEWDYFHGISAIKRTQSLYQGTLVAQGAFSIYDRQTVQTSGGFSDCVGEDIVLSWAILKAGHRIGHAEDAYVFTNVPDTMKQFFGQRKRWSRGAIEAFKTHPGILFKPRLSTYFIYWNFFFPVLDLIFTLSFVPGIILALFGYYYIAGPLTIALIPVAIAMNYIMFIIGRKTFRTRGLHVRSNVRGFITYSLIYGVIMQAVSVIGYYSELLNLKKDWGTK